MPPWVHYRKVMRLNRVSVSKYRSIDKAASFEVADFTVLIGPNNNGKSNLLRATVLAMQIIERWGRMQFSPRLDVPVSLVARFAPAGKRFRGSESVGYEWARDFPMFAQLKKGARKTTVINLEFALSADEQVAFKEATGISTNESLPIEISLSQKYVDLKIRKRGRGDHASKAAVIAKFIADRLSILHIAAIRTGATAMSITDELLSARRQELLQSQQAEDILAQLDAIDLQARLEVQATLKNTMARFVPEVTNVELEVRSLSRTSGLEEIYIDDGVRTAIGTKGDGVQSLVALALTLELTRASTGADKALIVAVEEPESHLHPGAVRELRSVLQDLAEQQQVIVTTHSQALVNRVSLRQNVVVDNRTATPAKELRDLRDALGVQLSDALAASEVSVIVEGYLDAAVLPALLNTLDSRTSTWIADGRVTFEAAGSGSKIYARALAARSILTEPIVVLDGDGAGMQDLQKLLDEAVIDANSVLQIRREGCAHSELEDVFLVDSYLTAVERAIGFALNSRQKGKLENGRDAAWSERLEAILIEAAHTDTKRAVKKAKYQLAGAVHDEIQRGTQVLKPQLMPSFERLIGMIDHQLNRS